MSLVSWPVAVAVTDGLAGTGVCWTKQTAGVSEAPVSLDRLLPEIGAVLGGVVLRVGEELEPVVAAA